MARHRVLRSWSRFFARALVAFLAVCGIEKAWASPRATAPIERLGEIRERLLERDRTAGGDVAPDAGNTNASRTAQWLNWPNFWRDWPNWANWFNY